MIPQIYDVINLWFQIIIVVCHVLWYHSVHNIMTMMILWHYSTYYIVFWSRRYYASDIMICSYDIVNQSIWLLLWYFTWDNKLLRLLGRFRCVVPVLQSMVSAAKSYFSDWIVFLLPTSCSVDADASNSLLVHARGYSIGLSTFTESTTVVESSLPQ